MDKKIAGVIGAVAALAAFDASAATQDTRELLNPASYADLLTPVSNATVRLRTLDQEQAGERKQVAQYYSEDHHHHHHNRYRGLPPVVREFLPHHHHHHNRYYRRDRDD